jgi:CheY-like chemotaxis protein
MPNAERSAPTDPPPRSVLVAEDDPVARQVLESVLAAAGQRVTATANGLDAWNAWSLSQQSIVLSDWLMPELDGLDPPQRQAELPHPEELTARLGVAQRILALRRELTQLEALLPICSYCKRIRDANQTWQPVERYVGARSGAEFSHGICPECYRKHIEPQLK